MFHGIRGLQQQQDPVLFPFIRFLLLIQFRVIRQLVPTPASYTVDKFQGRQKTIQAHMWPIWNHQLN